VNRLQVIVAKARARAYEIRNASPSYQRAAKRLGL